MEIEEEEDREKDKEESEVYIAFDTLSGNLVLC